jgi:hypothetical protein
MRGPGDLRVALGPHGTLLEFITLMIYQPAAPGRNIILPYIMSYIIQLI